ncbi:ribonuclease HII [Candidatus Woesearchaeota archaeon]|nr:ribonuclease HII [Candidatus Woesearchaeota archaeon]
MPLICGIDEAGRGPVIGPLVVCGVTIEEEKEYLLRQIGAKDSKQLSPERRERIAEQLKGMAKVELRVFQPPEIDTAVYAKGLNRLEAQAIASIINALQPQKAYVDCPSTNIAAFTDELQGMLTCTCEIVAEHKADANHPIVGAASIVAKVTRDRQIEELKKEFKVDFGSGYPADPRTKAFLEQQKDYVFIRKSWSTVRRLSQKGLDDF